MGPLRLRGAKRSGRGREGVGGIDVVDALQEEVARDHVRAHVEVPHELQRFEQFSN